MGSRGTLLALEVSVKFWHMANRLAKRVPADGRVFWLEQLMGVFVHVRHYAGRP